MNPGQFSQTSQKQRIHVQPRHPTTSNYLSAAVLGSERPNSNAINRGSPPQSDTISGHSGGHCIDPNSPTEAGHNLTAASGLAEPAYQPSLFLNSSLRKLRKLLSSFVPILHELGADNYRRKEDPSLIADLVTERLKHRPSET